MINARPLGPRARVGRGLGFRRPGDPHRQFDVPGEIEGRPGCFYAPLKAFFVFGLELGEMSSGELRRFVRKPEQSSLGAKRFVKSAAK